MKFIALLQSFAAPTLTLPRRTGEGIERFSFGEGIEAFSSGSLPCDSGGGLGWGQVFANTCSIFILAATFATAHAKSLDYDIARATELRACDDHANHGRVDEANECYNDVFTTSRNNYIRAQAAWAVNDLSTANTLFRATLQRDPNSKLTRLAWGRLFIETHQYDEALKLFREVQSSDGNNVQAKLGMAVVYADRFEGTARKLVTEILKADDELIEAHLLMARMNLEEGQLPEADASLDRAQSLADKHKFPPLEIYALRAALEVHKGNDGSKWTKRALDYNPHYGTIFETMAHMEIMRRRYREATEFLRRAVTVEPGLASAHAELGLNLLRQGIVEEGQKQLATSYEGDPYNITTVNTLRLLDRFKEFEPISVKAQVGDNPVRDNQIRALELRLHRTEAAVLSPYVQELAQASIATFARRYRFEPKQPITVEVYPNHDDFAVRVGGLPGVGLLGVTFGYLVAMDSPSGRASGDFHWGSTLWHEMAHVFTLEATDHHVPRWLSEGISVFEEWRTGPTPGVIVTPDVLGAFHEGRFLKIEDLDSGFIRPSYPNQVQVSYTQAGLTCLFIEQRYGFDKLVALLEQFKRDVSVASAVKASLSISSTEFDHAFDEFIKQRYAKILPNMSEWQKLYDTASAAADKAEWKSVIEPARRTIEMYSEHVGPSSPYLLLAKAYSELKQPDNALKTLLQYRQAGGWDPQTLLQLSELLQSAHRDSEAIEVLNAVNYSDPLHTESHLRLADALLVAKRPLDARREYQALLALDTHDKATAFLGLARATRAMGDRVSSKRNVLQALENAPHFRPAQDLLLEMSEERE